MTTEGIDTFGMAEARARYRLNARGIDATNAAAVARFASTIRDIDPHAAAVAYHLAARVAGRSERFVEGQRYARESTRIEVDTSRHGPGGRWCPVMTKKGKPCPFGAKMYDPAKHRRYCHVHADHARCVPV